MMRSFMKKSKAGVTLVESVIAVALLAFAVTGILTMLTVSGTKIFQLSDKSASYAEATQRLDLVISTISNSDYASSTYTDAEGISKNFISASGVLDPGMVLEALELTSDCDLIVADTALYPESAIPNPVTDTRGWYLQLTYDGVTVEGFASYTEGSFDKHALS